MLMKVWWNSSKDSWTQLDCYDDNEEHELVEVCINNMLWEYRLHLEKVNIYCAICRSITEGSKDSPHSIREEIKES